jgi:phosphoenolpyruvate carboxylase
VLPEPREVPFSVECPSGFQPIIAPAPRSVAIVKDSIRRFEGQLTGEQSAVHIAVANLARDAAIWTSRFSPSDDQLMNDLRVLVDKIDNPCVRPLLMTSQYASFFNSGKLWDAHLVSMQIRQEHPDFAELLDSLCGHLHRADEAKQLYEWVMQKANSPSLTTEEDLKGFNVQLGNSDQQLTPEHLQELADRVERLNEDSLTLQQKMGCCFILCQAGIHTAGK